LKEKTFRKATGARGRRYPADSEGKERLLGEKEEQDNPCSVRKEQHLAQGEERRRFSNQRVRETQFLLPQWKETRAVEKQH